MEKPRGAETVNPRNQANDSIGVRLQVSSTEFLLYGHEPLFLEQNLGNGRGVKEWSW